MEKKSESNFLSVELDALTSDAFTYCCTRVMWWRQLHV